MPFKPVSTAIQYVVGPLIDDTDFKSLETSIAYNAAGMAIKLVCEPYDGSEPYATDITLTSSGNNDWAHVGGGYYSIEITAVQNVDLGVSYIVGSCTGVLPFRSPAFDVVATKVYNSLVPGTDNLEVDAVQISGDSTAADNCELMFDGTGYAGGTTKLDVNAATIANGAITAAAIATDAIDADALKADAVAEIADGVWDEALSGHSGAGSAGDALNDAAVNAAQANSVTAQLGAMIEADGEDYRFTENALEEAPSGTGSGMALTDEVEGTVTVKQVLAILLALAAGTTAGGRTTTVVFHNQAGTVHRITGTMDADQNRTAVTLDVSDL